MEDHIFGTFSTDALKLLHERASALGLQHRSRRSPLDPRPDEPITLTVTSGPDFAPREVALFYTTDGSTPSSESATLSFQPVARQWNTLVWGYVTMWKVTLPGQTEGALVRYRIAARESSETWLWADWPLPKVAVEEALVRGESALHVTPGAPSDFALTIDRFEVPAWARAAVVYQVFLDRFAQEAEQPWAPPATLFDIYGGTLRGAIEKLEHIASLGATCIWLSPLFPSPTHHGYDATDYYTVEPRLGTPEALREFVDRAHALGIRVILDFICNHVSDEHPAFRRALADPANSERQWFSIDPSYAPHGYRAFFGVSSMPELNTDHPGVRDYLIRAAEMWVRDFDVDGFRLDYAHGPSHAFWAEFWRAVKQIKPDAWCFGEVVDTPDNERGYHGYLDGVLDFHIGEGLRHVFAYRTADLIWFDGFLRAHDAFFPSHDEFSRPAFLDNHDMDRFLFAAEGAVERLTLATLVLYTLPNPPLLYYGTEVALRQRFGKSEGYGLEVSREPMDWSRLRSEAEILDFFRRLGKLRRDEPAMRPSQRETLLVESDHYLGRHSREGTDLLVALNRSDEPARLHHSTLEGTFYDLLSEARIQLSGTIALRGSEGRILKRAG